jgi:hypothetical protein
MNGANEKRSTSAATRELIILPNWLPPSVEKEIRRIEKRDLSSEQHAILLRLATNEQMRNVWRELTRRNSSGFVTQAKRSGNSLSRSQNEVQDDALREILHFSFCAARDKPAVSKPGDVEREKNKLFEKAMILRELARIGPVSDFTAEKAIPDEARLKPPNFFSESEMRKFADFYRNTPLVAILCQSLYVMAKTISKSAAAS